LLRPLDVFRTVGRCDPIHVKTCIRCRTQLFTRTPGDPKLLSKKYVFIRFRELYSVVFDDSVLRNSVHVINSF